MEDKIAESGIVLVPFLAVVALLVYTCIAALFVAYPFNLDRRLKRRRVRMLLLANLSLAAASTIVLSLYFAFGPPGYHVSSEPTHYIWMLLSLGGAHTLFVQVPGAVISNLIDRHTAREFASLADTVGNTLYSEHKDEALQSLRQIVTQDEELLRDYGLFHIVRYYSDPSLDYRLSEVGGYVLQKLEGSQSRLTHLESPFKELNFIFSITGASALVGIALATV